MEKVDERHQVELRTDMFREAMRPWIPPSAVSELRRRVQNQLNPLNWHAMIEATSQIPTETDYCGIRIG